MSLTNTGVISRDVNGVLVLGFTRDAQARASLEVVRFFFIHHLLESTAGQHRVLIDLGGVVSLDSSCLGPLVQKLKSVQEHDGRLVLAAVDSPALREIFALTRFDKVFPVFPTVAEGLASF